MQIINSSITIGNIALEAAKRGKTGISFDEIANCADILNERLSKKNLGVLINGNDVLTFAYAYSFICDLADRQLVFKQEGTKPLLSRMERYFRLGAPRALVEAIEGTI